jgi:predicted peptidase
MPLTFYDLLQQKQDKAKMTIFLPVNYDPVRKFPLLVFLNGWDGGPGGNPDVARSLCEGKDFVCVSVPLFKAPGFAAKQPNVPGPGFIMVAEDGKYMWPFLKTMLEKLEARVPNIDPNRCVLGGFSNGAHATSALIDGSDGEITQRFSAFLLVEGGGRLQHYERLKDKPLLMVSSNSKSKPRAQEICDTAKTAGAKATLLVEDVGKHDFPVSAYPAVRQWLRSVISE